MTTAKPVVTTPKFQRHFAMPDPPEREPDDMTSFNHLSVTGGPLSADPTTSETPTLPSSAESTTSAANPLTTWKG